MAELLRFDRSEPDGCGRAVALSPLVSRLVAPNSGAFTFTGTCTYLIGRDRLVVIDPGPDDDHHFEALIAAIDKRDVTHILVTHTHKDHSPLARRLAIETGAVIWGAAPHFAARHLGVDEVNLLDASVDDRHNPDRILGDGDVFNCGQLNFEVVATPGHTMNHLSFAFRNEQSLFSGDHVMAWSTSIVAPPDGSMRAYMQSLDKLRLRRETHYFPGHGAPVQNPQDYVLALIAHRQAREASILDALSHHPATIAKLVEDIYVGLADQLKIAAGLSVFAHLEDLVARELVKTDGPVTLESHYRLF